MKVAFSRKIPAYEAKPRAKGIFYSLVGKFCVGNEPAFIKSALLAIVIINTSKIVKTGFNIKGDFQVGFQAELIMKFGLAHNQTIFIPSHKIHLMLGAMAFNILIRFNMITSCPKNFGHKF